jgi:spore coat protein U-like protein
MRWLFGLVATALVGIGTSQAGDTNVLSVSGTVISKHNCMFTTANSSLNFGVLNPANTANAVASTDIGFRCNGNPNKTLAYSIDHNGGLNFGVGAPGPKMERQTAPADLLPYSLTLSPANGTGLSNTNYTLTVSGVVQAIHYQNARPGSYLDTVVLSITP